MTVDPGAVGGLPERMLRVGDAERERAAGALGGHYVEGRLDRAEFDARLSAAYGARTRGDLAVLLADLPGPGWAAPSYRLPAGDRPRTSPRPAPRRRGPGLPPLLPLVVLFVALTAVIGFPPVFLLPVLWLVWSRRACR